MLQLTPEEILEEPSPMEDSVLDLILNAFKDNLETLNKPGFPALREIDYWEPHIRKGVTNPVTQEIYPGWRIQLFKIGQLFDRALALYAIKDNEETRLLRTYCHTHCTPDELPEVMKQYHQRVVRYCVERGVNLDLLAAL